MQLTLRLGTWPPLLDSVLAYWIHDLSPFLIRFTESFGIRWYGLAYIVGFVMAIWLLKCYEKHGRSSLNAEERSTLLTALVIGTLAGGRIGYVLLYRLETFLSDPLMLVRVYEGGMASHGGILGIALALWWFSRWVNRRRSRLGSPDASRVSFLQVADLVCTLGPPGIILGRLANFINGELWGRITDAPWAVIFPAAQRYPHFDPSAFTVPVNLPEVGIILANPRHPSQLYAMVLEGIVLTVYLQWRFWKSGITRRHPGHLGAEFLIAYAVLRLMSEVYREPDASLILGLSRGMFYSLFMIACGVGVILWLRRRPVDA